MPETIPVSSTEIAAEVESLEKLINEHRGLSRTIVDLHGKYGPFGVADDIRKAELYRIRCLLRDEYGRTGTKVTEAQLDAEAHAHETYRDLLELMAKEREKYLLAYHELQYIEWRVNRANAILRQRSLEGLR